MSLSKEYTDVLVHFDEYGGIQPLSILWDDGRDFEIDHIKDDGNRSAATGGAGHRFTIRIEEQIRHLFLASDYEHDGALCWFVESRRGKREEGIYAS